MKAKEVQFYSKSVCSLLQLMAESVKYFYLTFTFRKLTRARTYICLLSDVFSRPVISVLDRKLSVIKGS